MQHETNRKLLPKKTCFTDPSATACTGTYSDSDGTMLPSVLADKCSSTTCTTLTTDLTVVKDCFTGVLLLFVVAISYLRQIKSVLQYAHRID